MRTELFWVTMLVILYQGFGTTYWSHQQASRIQPMKMEPIGCPETWVRNYHYLVHNNPKELSSHIINLFLTVVCLIIVARKITAHFIIF
jgi:hypothetical protein